MQCATRLLVLCCIGLGFGASAATKTVTMGLTTGGVNYSLSSTNPFGSAFRSKSLQASTLELTFDYTPPPPNTMSCPSSVSSVTIEPGNEIWIEDLTLTLNWWPTSLGSFTLAAGTIAGELQGSNLPVSGSSVNFTGAAVEVNDGQINESGTGSLGSSLTRTKVFSSSPESYPIDSGYLSFMPSGPSCGVLFNVSMTDGEAPLWDSPLISYYFNMVANFGGSANFQ